MTEEYDDEWFAAMLERLAAAVGEPREAVERGFGAYAGSVAFPGLYPDYYASSGDVFRFLLGIEEKIHELIRTTIPGAYPPHLHVRPLGEAGVLISYTSERGLCRLLEGLVHGTAARLGQQVVLEELQCMHRDDPGCVFSVLPAAA